MPNLLRYPLNIDQAGRAGLHKVPYMTFRAFTPKYEGDGTKIIGKLSDQTVVLHMPLSHAITDTMSYQTHMGGLTQAMMDKTIRGTQSVLSGEAGEMTREEIGAALERNADAAGRIAEEMLPIQRRMRRRQQQNILNPREYVLFKEMAQRTFSLSFTFIPHSEEEAEIVPQIIKYFRYHSYPSLSENGIDFNFPEQFQIQIIGTGVSKNIIQIPKVACTAITTTYNPSSMSYFKNSKHPVQTELSLTFQELEPITDEFIKEGY